MTGEPRGFSQDAEEFSSYDGKFGLPLVLAQGSPNFHSSCEGELGVALESLQGKRDLTQACFQDLMFLSRGDSDLVMAFQTHPGSPTSSRGEANLRSTLESRRVSLGAH